MRNIGIVLVVAGVAALVYGGFTYPRQGEGLDSGTGGDHRRRAEELPVPAAAGSAVLLTGFVLVVAGNRRLRPNRAPAVRRPQSE
ncbi:MAG: hypothetical protein IPI48_02780 [bacterium]|nr:hypothetical protein [bacterium]